MLHGLGDVPQPKPVANNAIEELSDVAFGGSGRDPCQHRPIPAVRAERSIHQRTIGHALSFHGSWFANQELCDIERPQRIVALAIEALKLPAAGVLLEQELLELAAIRADMRQGTFLHETLELCS
jgi:hypothetical protein